MGKKNKFKKDSDSASSTSATSGNQPAQPPAQPAQASTSQAASGQQSRPQPQMGPGRSQGGQQQERKPTEGAPGQGQGSGKQSGGGQPQSQQGSQAWGGQKQGGQPWGGQKQGDQGRAGPPAGQGQQSSGQQPQQQQWKGQSQGGQGQRGPPAGQGQQSSGQQSQQQQWKGQSQGGQGQRGPPAGQGQQSSGQQQQQYRGQQQGGQGRGGPQQQQWRDQPQGGRGRGQPTGRDQQSFGPQSQQHGQQGGYSQRGHGQGQQGGGDQRQAVRLQPQSCRPGDAVSCTGIKRGTLGQPGQVSVNYLDIDLSKMPPVAYHYDVKLDPDRPKKFYRAAFEQFRVQFLGNSSVAYDGRNSCYSVDKLTHLNRAEEIEVVDGNGRSLHFKVEIKETENVEVLLSSLKSYSRDRVFDKPMRALQCLEVVLSSGCHEMAVRAGRSFFKKPERSFDLGDGYEAWTGLYQAAILGDQPFMNVDISHKSFPRGMPIIEYLERYVANQRFNQDSTIDQYTLRNIKPFLKGITVVYKPPASFATAPRNFRVVDLTDRSASQLEFTMGEGNEKQRMTVQQYFASRNYKLQYPKLICLHVGSTIKPVYLPLELCEIQEGQAINKKDGSRQVQNMIKFAATSTNERRRKIMDLLQYFNHNKFDTVERFGVQIGNNFIVVPTRILPSPRMEYFRKEFILPRNGSWQMSNRTSFLATKSPPNGNKWAILHFNMPFNVISQLADMVKRQAQSLSIQLDPTPRIEPVNNLDKTFMNMKNEKFNLVFVILPNRGPSYADVKQKAELNYGILTQCIKQNTLNRLSPQLISNILLKVNSKLNGTNHKIEDATHVPLDNVMYLGADVTHPSPDQKFIPSVVGVAASHDRFGANYNMQYRLQNGTDEIIVDMESIVTEHLRVYYEYQKSYPKHIIYYRDGVSDGQFPLVKNKELKGIKLACAKLKISPSLTCVIVVKRHHTRFFPDGEPQQYNKFNNVTPGTVVDRVIVHPNEMQFFMVSHQSIQGTAKPTRYNVIENTAKLDVDLLQKLTYNLCHLFPRCNRVVSYPAPAYLAHLVAYRGRVYLEGTTRFADPKSEYQRRLVNSNFMRSNPMYFV